MRCSGHSSTFSVHKLQFSVDKKQSRFIKSTQMPTVAEKGLSTGYFVFIYRVSSLPQKSCQHVWKASVFALGGVLAAMNFFIHKLSTLWKSCGRYGV